MQAQLIRSYIEVRDKLIRISSEQLDVSVEKIDLFVNFYETYGCDELDTIEFVMSIEEEFDIEIPENDWDEMSILYDILTYLLKEKNSDVGLDTIKSFNQEMQALIVFSFLDKNSLEQNVLVDIIQHASFISQYALLEKFRKTVNLQGLKINEIVEFSEIIRDDYLMSNLDHIYKILGFLNISKISKDEVLILVKEGYVESWEDQIKSTRNSISQKKLDIQNKNNELQKLINEVKLMEQELEFFEAVF